MTKNTIDVSNELEDAIKYAATNILCLFISGNVFVGRTEVIAYNTSGKLLYKCVVG